MYRLIKISAVLGVFVIGFVIGSVDAQLDMERQLRAGPGWRR